jgi:hypothetical protein
MYAREMHAPKEVRASKLIRQFHRWTSAVFVLTVIGTTIALAQPEPILWMSYVPLAPLALLALTGIHMFFQPYAAKWRRGRAG